MQSFEPTPEGQQVYDKLITKLPYYKTIVETYAKESQFTGEPIKMFTCANCPAVANFILNEGDKPSVCPWAFDLYNTDGDCLALK